MILAVDENGGQVLAENAEKGRHYFCPVCDSHVTLKQGPVKTAHFSHHHILDCMRYLYKRESVEHLELKHDLYLALTPHYPAAMEYYLRDIEQIADLLIGEKLALEIQLSTISPQLIIDRTEGYASIGIDVIWLLDDAAIRTAGPYIRPTHFQLSAQKEGKLFTIDTKSKQVFLLHIRHHVGGGRFYFKKEKLDVKSLAGRFPMEKLVPRRLSNQELEAIVSRERSRRTVQNLTLTFLYHTGLAVGTLPGYLKYTTPAERLIMNPPLEWKLFIYYHLDRGTFNMELFKEMLKPRQIYGVSAKEQLAKDLIKDYLMLYNSHKGSKLEISNRN